MNEDLIDPWDMESEYDLLKSALRENGFEQYSSGEWIKQYPNGRYIQATHNGTEIAFNFNDEEMCYVSPRVVIKIMLGT